MEKGRGSVDAPAVGWGDTSGAARRTTLDGQGAALRLGALTATFRAATFRAATSLTATSLTATSLTATSLTATSLTATALTCAALTAAALTATLSMPAGHAAAQEPSSLRLRGTVAGGFAISEDQLGWLDLDLPVLEGALRAGYVLADPVVLELGAGAGAWFSSSDAPGGLIDLVGGVEVGVREGIARIWLGVHAGVGFTGPLVRPVLRLALGVDLTVTDEVAVGPTFAYGHVFQEDGDGYSDDAQLLSLGLSLTVRPTLPPPDPPALEPSRPRPPPARRPRPPLPDPAPPPVPTTELMGYLDEAAGLSPRELLVPVLFAFDSTEIVACTRPSLYALRDHLAAHPELALVEIEGHADGQGDDAYNDALSLRRAQAIRDWLIEHGIEPGRLRAAARGEGTPLEGNEEEDGRTQNRRARFLVIEEAR